MGNNAPGLYPKKFDLKTLLNKPAMYPDKDDTAEVTLARLYEVPSFREFEREKNKLSLYPKAD